MLTGKGAEGHVPQMAIPGESGITQGDNSTEAIERDLLGIRVSRVFLKGNRTPRRSANNEE